MNETEHDDTMAVKYETGLVPVGDQTAPVALTDEMELAEGEINRSEIEYSENVFRRHIKEDPNKIKFAKHKLWLDSLQHEYPLPYVDYRVGVYIRFFNQTKYSDEVYLEKHKAQFREDIALCPKWSLVDFYIDSGSVAPGMEYSKEWLRLLDDCFVGKVDLIVTQKVSNVSSDPSEIGLIARLLANQNPPIGIYFISEDIFTLASYFWADLRDEGFALPGWKPLPPDELDLLPVSNHPELMEGEEDKNMQQHDERGPTSSGEVV